MWGGLWKGPNFLDQFQSRWTLLEYFCARESQDPNQMPGFELDTSDLMGRQDFSCLYICPHGANVLKWYLRNVDVRFHFISSWIGERRGLRTSISKSGFFWWLRDISFFSWKKERKNQKMRWIGIHFLFFFFDFKTVKTPREAEQLVSFTNRQQKQESKKFLLWQLYHHYSSDSIRGWWLCSLACKILHF